MAGRLEQYNDFIEKSTYQMTEKKPLVKNTEQKKKEVEQSLASDNTNIVLQTSRKHNLICFVFLKSGYRMVVVPEKKLANKRYKSNLYIEVVDIKSKTRKTFRRDRIRKAKLTSKPCPFNTDMIKFK